MPEASGCPVRPAGMGLPSATVYTKVVPQAIWLSTHAGNSPACDRRCALHTVIRGPAELKFAPTTCGSLAIREMSSRLAEALRCRSLDGLRDLPRSCRPPKISRGIMAWIIGLSPVGRHPTFQSLFWWGGRLDGNAGRSRVAGGVSILVSVELVIQSETKIKSAEKTKIRLIPCFNHGTETRLYQSLK